MGIWSQTKQQTRIAGKEQADKALGGSVVFQGAYANTRLLGGMIAL